MADHNKTITNSLGVLAASPGSLWGTFEWAEVWGQDEDLWTETQKGITDTLTVENILSRTVSLTISNSLVLTEDLSSIAKSIGIWDYVFTSPTAEGRSKVFDDSSKVSDASTDWTAVSDTSSTWSDV